MFCVIVIGLVVYLLFDWLIRLLKVGNFSNKYVLISGCDSGFGRDLALRLDKMGFPVIAGCLTEGGRKSLEEVCSSKVTTLTLDIGNDDSIQAALETVKRTLPSENALWALVNNAGITGVIAPIEMTTRKNYIDACQINSFGHMEMTRVFMPLLRQSRGRVVTITSIMGRCPATHASYTVSKFGLEGFCDVLRREVARFGVKVSIIEPGYFNTTLLTNSERIQNTIKAGFAQASPEVLAAYGEEYRNHMMKLATEVTSFGSNDIYKVVDAYVNAITSTYPRPRYTVGNDAKFFFTPLTFLPEWVLDWMLLRAEKSMAKN